MDPLIILSQTHKKIAETPLMYQKIMTSINFTDMVEYVKDLDELSREIVLPHFDYEEKEIFPDLLFKGFPDLNKLIEELKEEHKQMNEKLDRIKEMSKKLRDDPAATQKDKEKLSALCTEITRELVEHGQKEDEKLFPLLK